MRLDVVPLAAQPGAGVVEHQQVSDNLVRSLNRRTNTGEKNKFTGLGHLLLSFGGAEVVDEKLRCVSIGRLRAQSCIARISEVLFDRSKTDRSLGLARVLNVTNPEQTLAADNGIGHRGV